MEIQIASGTGTGPTKLAAFDAALIEAGVANYNLIFLSSIIPPKSKIVELDKPANPPGEWGDRLYVVIAEERISTPNTEVWAGIGWTQDKKTGKGLLVEHYGGSRKKVENDIKDSLSALISNRKDKFGPIHMKLSGTICKHQPVCALVIAVFNNDSWLNN